MRTYLGRKDLREDVEVAGRPELAPMEPIDDLPSVGSGGLEADTENLPAQPDVQAQSKKKTPKSWSKSWSKARSRAAVTFSSLRGRPTQGSPEQFEAQEVETPLVAAKKVEKPRRKLQGLAPDMAESDAFQPFIEEDLLKNIMAFDQPCPPVRRRGRGYRPSVLSFYGNTSQGPPVPQERLVELDAHQNDIHAAVTTGSQPSDQVPGTSKVDASTNT